jgi:hypothetical protein
MDEADQQDAKMLRITRDESRNYGVLGTNPANLGRGEGSATERRCMRRFRPKRVLDWKCIAQMWRGSRLEHGADFPIAYSVIGKSEGAGFSHFPRSAKKSA